MVEKPSDIEPKPSPWTPEMVREILFGITDLADRFLTLEEGRLKHKIQKSEAEAKAGWKVLGEPDFFCLSSEQANSETNLKSA